MKTSILIVFCMSVSFYIHAQKTWIFTGTADRNDPDPVSLLILDESNGELEAVREFPGASGPGYLCISPCGNYLYCTDENSLEGNDRSGSIRAFRIEKKTKNLIPAGGQSSHGIHPCHISVHPSGTLVFTANYNSGSISVHPVDNKGIPGPAIATYQWEGSGPVEARQKGPHAHYIHPAPGGNYIYGADLGSDKVLIYRYDEEKGILPNEDMAFLSMNPGSGPRHMAFHPGGRFAFILNELSNELVSCSLNRKTGELKIIGSWPTLESSFKEYSKAAAVRVGPEGKYIYCSNRGENSIAVFQMNENGKLVKIQTFKEGLSTVRDFNITPSGKYLLAGNQDKNEIVVLKILPDGKLALSGKKAIVHQPTCIAFLK